MKNNLTPPAIRATDATTRLAPNIKDVASKEFLLRLYISGTTPASARAVVNLRRLCEAYLKDRYELEIVALAEHVALAAADQIIATPTLLKLKPLPLRRLIGDLSDETRVLTSLNIPPTRDRNA